MASKTFVLFVGFIFSLYQNLTLIDDAIETVCFLFVNIDCYFFIRLMIELDSSLVIMQVKYYEQ